MTMQTYILPQTSRVSPSSAKSGGEIGVREMGIGMGIADDPAKELLLCPSATPMVEHGCRGNVGSSRKLWVR